MEISPPEDVNVPLIVTKPVWLIVNAPPVVALLLVLMGAAAELVKTVPVLLKIPPPVVTGAVTETRPPVAAKLTFKGSVLDPEMAAATLMAPAAGSGVRVKVVAAAPPGVEALVIAADTVIVPVCAPVQVVVMLTLPVLRASEMVVALTIAVS